MVVPKEEMPLIPPALPNTSTLLFATLPAVAPARYAASVLILDPLTTIVVAPSEVIVAILFDPSKINALLAAAVPAVTPVV